jgi:hypothetical protein
MRAQGPIFAVRRRARRARRRRSSWSSDTKPTTCNTARTGLVGDLLFGRLSAPSSSSMHGRDLT